MFSLATPIYHCIGSLVKTTRQENAECGISIRIDIDQWTITENAYINPGILGQLIFNKSVKNVLP